MKSSWSAPSNIALVKYWGKKSGLQIPANPSVSLTLDLCRTYSEITLSSKDHQRVRVIFDGEENQSFVPKIKSFLDRVTKYFSFLNDYSLTIDSRNTFPHSSGIASSASSFASFALCLVDLEQKVTGKSLSENDFLNKASFIARLGSGSASRSLFKGACFWGKLNDKLGSDEFAVPLDLSSRFENVGDRVLLIEKGSKKVSSTQGHALMNDHFYKERRYAQAHLNMKTSLDILQSGCLKDLGELIELEALTLHSMMMMSRPSFILMKPETLKAIESIRNFRKESGASVYFTLDAGANVHMLYDLEDKKRVDSFYETSLKSLCSDSESIDDRVGKGPVCHA